MQEFTLSLLVVHLMLDLAILYKIHKCDKQAYK